MTYVLSVDLRIDSLQYTPPKSVLSLQIAAECYVIAGDSLISVLLLFQDLYLCSVDACDLTNWSLDGLGGFWIIALVNTDAASTITSLKSSFRVFLAGGWFPIIGRGGGDSRLACVPWSSILANSRNWGMLNFSPCISFNPLASIAVTWRSYKTNMDPTRHSPFRILYHFISSSLSNPAHAQSIPLLRNFT